MMSFRNQRLRDLSLPTASVWLMTEIAERKGRQELYTRQSPQVLCALREQALIQSAESSNRIEGVTASPDRLVPLVIGDARPRDRSEEEVQGYRRALELIHTKAPDLQLTGELVQRLHETIQHGAGDAGQWKRIDNDIIELRPCQAPVIRFRTVRASDTPTAMEELLLCIGTRSIRSTCRRWSRSRP